MEEGRHQANSTIHADYLGNPLNGNVIRNINIIRKSLKNIKDRIQDHLQDHP